MSSASLLILVPYFAYVFDFLDPEKVIARIGVQTLERATARDARERRADLHRAPGAGGERPGAPGRHRGERARAEGQGDRLRRLGGACGASWSTTRAARRRSSPSGSPSARRCAPTRTSWRWRTSRWRIWRATAPGWSGRGCGRSARCSAPRSTACRRWRTWWRSTPATSARRRSAAGNREVFALTVKFMNTYLRAALNGKDVRTAYNVLNQYRQLAEALLARRGRRRLGARRRVVEIAGHFKYYARLAHAQRDGVRDRDGRLRSLRAVRGGEHAPLARARSAAGDLPGDRRSRRGAGAARRAQGAGQAGVVLPGRAARRRARRRSTTT